MQAAVKTPHTEIRITGKIPQRLIDVLREEFGPALHLEPDDDEPVDVFATDWFQETRARMTPGNILRIYRENHRMTQTTLGEKLGRLPKQHISNMERGQRPISLATAKKLAAIFNVPVTRFFVIKG